MSRWWRAYDEAVDDPKLQCLSDESFRFWFNLCCVCSAFSGNLPNEKHLAFKLRMQPRKVRRLLDELIASGLIDEDDQGARPHNWHGRQYKSDVTDSTNATRQKRYRERHRNAVTPVTVTAPRVQIQNTDTETERKNAASAAPAIDYEVELFRRGKEILGPSSGGLITQLLKAKEGKINLARAAIETAAGKENPREYVGKIIRNQDPPPGEVSRYVDGRL